VASTHTYLLFRAFLDLTNRRALQPYDNTRLNEVIISWHERAEPIDYDQMNHDLRVFGEDVRAEIIARIYHGVELLEQYAARS
jgi:hypothetical protein